MRPLPLAGVYNWDFVFGLEQIVEWCRAHGVKVLFTILDNWSPVDSKTSVRAPLGSRPPGVVSL